ncbi:hypothetical protein [Janthinobacterium lividum]
MQKLTYLFATALTLSVPILANSAAKTVPLSTAEERQWINAVKTHKTADGKTVMEVLSRVEKRSHGRFKVASYDVFYDWSGQPSTVVISYWIGTKRKRDLAFSDLAYPMNRNGTIAKIALVDRPTLAALEKGVEAMLAEIDEHYHMDCPPDMLSDNC